MIIPGEKSFFETGLADASCDVVLSQDALLHAGSERHRALGEAARILKPGGLMVFSDIMQAEEADPKDLKEVMMVYPMASEDGYLVCMKRRKTEESRSVFFWIHWINPST